MTKQIAGKHKVYAALTVDWGVGERDEATQAANVLDLNGLLRADDVVGFCEALMAWRAEVLARNATAKATRAVREQIRKIQEAA